MTTSPLDWLRQAFVPRYLSLGLIWGWISCMWITGAISPGHSGISIFSGSAWLPSATFVVLGLFGAAFLLRDGCSRLRGPTIIVATVLMTGATALTWLCQDATALIHIVLGAATGIGSAILTVGSCGILSEVETEQLELSLPACTIVSAAVAVSTSFLDAIPIAMLSCVLPLAAGALLGWATASAPALPTTKPHAEQEPVSRAAMLGTLTNLIAYMSICFVEVSLPLQWVASFNPYAHLLTSVLAVALILVAIGNSVRVSTQNVYRWTMPFLICSLALSLSGEQIPCGIAYLISRTCSVMLKSLLGVYFLTLAHRGRIGGCRAGGFYLGTCQLGVLVGNALVITPSGLDHDQWALWVRPGLHLPARRRQRRAALALGRGPARQANGEQNHA